MPKRWLKLLASDSRRNTVWKPRLNSAVSALRLSILPGFLRIEMSTHFISSSSTSAPMYQIVSSFANVLQALSQEDTSMMHKEKVEALESTLSRRGIGWWTPTLIGTSYLSGTFPS